MTATYQDSITEIMAARLRHAAEVCERLELEPFSITVGSPNVHDGIFAQLKFEDFRQRFSGREARVASSPGTRHYYVIEDGIEFTACERGREEEGVVIL